jgi:hypothetical protein
LGSLLLSAAANVLVCGLLVSGGTPPTEPERQPAAAAPRTIPATSSRIAPVATVQERPPTVKGLDYTPYTAAKPSAAGTAAGVDYSRYYDYYYRPVVGEQYVRGYYRRDGTYVSGHYRTNPDDSF